MPAEWQQAFARALRDPALPPPDGLAGLAGTARLARRFSVYRNNHFVSLVDALADGYPVVQRLVGDEFFRAMARAYAAADAPRSPVMMEYGRGFARFIENFEPARSLPYLADVARLERAWQLAYHAADAGSLPAEAWKRISPERVGQTRLRLHPSVQLLRSPWPVFSIWEANADPQRDARMDRAAGAESVVLSRPRDRVEVRRLPAGAFPFLIALQEGQSIAAAADAALRDDEDFDLAANLQALIQCDLVVGFDPA